jgi:hypothetical protein
MELSIRAPALELAEKEVLQSAFFHRRIDPPAQQIRQDFTGAIA